MLIKDALTRWVAPSVSGTVEIELRRGDDYSILKTDAEYMAYAPDKLSMERTEEPAFSPADRIGALEMQNLSVTDNRAFLLHHLDAIARLGTGGSPLPELLGEGDAEPSKLKK
jgi:argininosuccinate synthase